MRKFVLLFSMVLLSLPLSAQNRRVSGTVIDSEGDPVGGVTVVVQGTNTVALTDPAGQYSITVPETSTLVYSFFGMVSQSIPVSGRTTINVTLMPDATSIESVVVLGLGVTRSEKSAGFATQKVDSELLSLTNNANIAGALQGKLSGVSITPSSGMPGASTQMVIRGARSFTGNNTPLYVIDGMPVASGTDISSGGTSAAGGSDYANRGVDIDPNDIEDIQVLKGQAASALYGMRASNGVVMITTKSGRSGEKGRTNVTFSTNFEVSEISRYPEFQTTYAQGSGGTYNPTSSMSWGPKIADLAKDAAFGYGGTGPVSAAHKNLIQSYWDQWQSSASAGEYFVPQRAFAGLDPWVTPRAYSNNVSDFFKSGVTTNNSVNISKTTDQSTISITLSNTLQSGIIPSTGMERYNAKILAETKLGKAWTLGFSGNYVDTRIDKATGANDGIVATVYPTPPSYDLGGIPAYYENTPWKQNTYRATGGFDAAYWYIDNNSFTERTSRFFGNAYLIFKPTLNNADHNLNFRLMIGNDSYSTKYRNLWGFGHQRSATVSGQAVTASGSVNNRLQDIGEFNGTFTANYDWTINDRLRLDVSLGSEFIDRNRQYFNYTGTNFNYPNWNHMDNATIYTSSETMRNYRSVGFFGTATLGFADQLFLNITGRNDIVSTMPTNSRSYFYPSASLGWVFTELEAINNRILSYGKVRLAISQVGQEGTYNSPYYEVPVYGGGFYSYAPFLWPHNGVTAFAPQSTVYDPALKPQNTNTVEAGLELTFFNGIIGLDYSFAHQSIKGQIFAVPYASSTGIAEVMRNAGHIVTKSHEATLTISPRLGRNFSWISAFNFTKLDNRVKSLADGVESIFLGGFVTPQVRASIGDPFPSIYGTGYMRDESGNIVVDAGGDPIAGEPKIIGYAQPKFVLGFNTTFRWKRLSLSTVLDWKNGGQMLAASGDILHMYGVTEESRIAREQGIRFTAVNQAGEIVNVEHKTMADVEDYYSKRNNIDEASIFDASYLKMRELSIGYEFKVGKDLNMGVNAYARNLLLWTRVPMIDPESSQGNDNMAGAFERFSLPQTSNYGLGLSLKF